MALEFGLGSVEWAPWSGTSWLCLLLVGLIYVSYSYELRVKAHGKKVAAEGASPKAKSLEEPLIRAEQGYGATGPQAPAGGMVVAGIVLDADKVVEVMRVGVLCFWMVLCSMAIIYTNAWILDNMCPHAATLTAIQTKIRCSAAMALARRKRRERLERLSATMIQSLARAVVARERVDALYDARDRKRRRDDGAATAIQTAARGRAARSEHGARLAVVLARRRAEHGGATAIARRIRGTLARSRARKLRDDRVAAMIADARRCVEQWNDDEATFMYYDDKARTQEWEPPPSGYLRRDGLLVLTNGRICEDPDNVLGDAEKARNAAEAAAAHLLGLLSAQASQPLADLQSFLAERLALENGDIRTVQDERFDDACVTLESLSNELHYAGRLGKPGAKPPLRLTEGAAKASADDAAPRGGVLAALAAQEERASEKKKEAAQESDAEEAAAAADEAAPEAARQDDAQTAASQDDWQQYFDDDGNPYWFNPMTGESTYDQPGAQAEEWTQVYDDSGNVYWYNQATGASQYEDPYDQQQGAYDEGGGAMVQYDEYGQAVEPYYDQTQQYAEPDPNGDWAQYQDEAGNWYWYNQATGESTYDQPA